MANVVKTRLEGPVFYISINRPEKKNCINHETARQLVTAFEKFNEDENAKVAVFHGEGSNFCTGYDLSEVSRGDFEHYDPDFLEKYRYLGPTNMKIKKPLIAAIEGYAVAGGLELSLMADMRVCGKSATFGVFCRKVGVPLIDGGTIRLPRVVGFGRAMDMILTGRGVGAEEALSWGLMNRVVSDGQAVAEATKLAQQIASFPEQCMLADRNSSYYSLDHTTEESFAREYENISVLGESIKGAQQFMQSQAKKKSKL
ncbi:unnamed protein product [Caenorhabditis auriculariae]|uniref:Uncharacterized protein n=1 Tax=Caenorhabditis auriculariae TaxID=2777116 RepID=A0A8S1HPY5_9PELO|nr:unnamed protein product [Caenorhabditis auriculariae]